MLPVTFLFVVAALSLYLSRARSFSLCSYPRCQAARYRSPPRLSSFCVLSQSQHNNKLITILLLPMPQPVFGSFFSLIFPSSFVRAGTPRTQVSLAQDLAHDARVRPGQGPGSHSAPHAARQRFRGVDSQGRKVCTWWLIYRHRPAETHQPFNGGVLPKQTQRSFLCPKIKPGEAKRPQRPPPSCSCSSLYSTACVLSIYPRVRCDGNLDVNGNDCQTLDTIRKGKYRPLIWTHGW